MKKMKKLLAIILSVTVALTMGMAVTATAFAAENGTITITPPAGAEGTNSYQIYKVFDATGNGTNITYKLCDGDSLTTAMSEAGFSVDEKGYVHGPADMSDEAIAAIAAYVTDADLVDTATSTGTNNAVSKSLPNGYYYIKTNTGAAVTITSTNPNASVNDKNEFSTIVKSEGTEYNAEALNAIAAVGTDQPFTIKVTKAHGATKLDVADTMTNLTFNNDLVVKIGNATVDAENYTLTPAESGFTLSFKEEYVKGLADNTELVINYTGKVASSALQTNPATNTATLTTDNDKKITTDVSKVYNAKLTISKVDDQEKALEGAGFTLYKKNGDDWVKVGEINSTEAEAKTEFAFEGLGVGEYKFEETQVPDGYNKADDGTFTIVDGDYTAENLVVTSTVVDKAGSVLPSTGGMGTTIFYILGALLVIGCGIVLVARRRSAAK
jgi:LPXTG-motif cell wall-anchored protein